MKSVKAITTLPGWVSELSKVSARVNDTASAYSYVPLVYRGVQVRADALASVPVKMVRRNKEADWFMVSPPGQLLWGIEASMLLAGAAYFEILRGTEIVDLRMINPFSMTVEYKSGEFTFKQSGMVKWKNRPADGEYEVLYIREYSPKDDINPGVSALDVALMDAQLARNMTRFAAKFFESGTMPVTLLGLEQPLSENEQKRVQGFFRRATEGIENAFRVLALRGEIKPQVLTQPIKDLTMPELYANVRDNIAQALGVPKSYFNEASNFATAEEDTSRFWTTTIRPRGEMIAGEINRQVFSRLRVPAEMVLDFDSMDVFQIDEGKRATSLLSLVNAGMPLQVALDVLGYDLSDEAQAVIDALPLTGNRPGGMFGNSVPNSPDDAMNADLRLWEKKASRRLKKEGSAQCQFESPNIPAEINAMVFSALAGVKDAEALPLVFNGVRLWKGYP